MSKTALSLEEIYHPVEARLTAVPTAILEVLSTPNELADDVIRYFFSAMGKLLRPALTCFGAEMVRAGMTSGMEKRLLHLAASYEIFHAATLIHDDIIDSAFLRRSIPTVNTKWNSQVAVLVGDYLHDKAIASIFENGNPEIFALFLKTAGQVCDGEILELKESCPILEG
jgi:geranylgeranyl pyrophosphate synthase